MARVCKTGGERISGIANLLIFACLLLTPEARKREREREHESNMLTGDLGGHFKICFIELEIIKQSVAALKQHRETMLWLLF